MQEPETYTGISCLGLKVFFFFLEKEKKKSSLQQFPSLSCAAE